MKFSEWSKEKTVLVRLSRVLRDYLKKVAKTRGVTILYLLNEAVSEKYFKYKKIK